MHTNDSDCFIVVWIYLGVFPCSTVAMSIPTHFQQTHLHSCYELPRQSMQMLFIFFSITSFEYFACTVEVPEINRHTISRKNTKRFIWMRMRSVYIQRNSSEFNMERGSPIQRINRFRRISTKAIQFSHDTDGTDRVKQIEYNSGICARICVHKIWQPKCVPTFAKCPCAFSSEWHFNHTCHNPNWVTWTKKINKWC